MSFKKLRGVRLPEEKQGLIRYTCLNFESLPEWMQKKIARLCDECGGEHSHALFEVMTTRRSMTEIALGNFVDESTLYRARKRFYENWEPRARTREEEKKAAETC